MIIRLLLSIELKKFIKRKDWISLIAIGAIGILFAGSSLSGTYVGPENQSALFWMVTQVFNSVALFIVPFVLAFMGTRILSAELEEKTLKPYIERIQDKKSIYLSKVFAFSIYSILVYIVVLIFQFLLYQIAVIKNPTFFSGKFLGENTWQLVIALVILWASSFYLPGIFAIMIGTKLKPTIVMGLTMGFVFILRNAYRLSILEWINPWTYIVKLVSPVSVDTNYYAVDSFYWQEFACFAGIFILYTFIQVLVGIKLFNRIKLR